MRSIERAALSWGLVLALGAVCAASAGEPEEDTERAAQGLRFRVAEASPAAPPHERTPPVDRSRPLSAARLHALLQRLPEPSPPSEASGDAVLRERSTPPPRTGATLLAPWPPEDGAQPFEPAGSGNAEAALRVLRVAPQGEVALAPQLSISFNQSMVAVASQSALAEQVPVQLEPQPAGRWRWVGTRTLVFDPEGGRLPMATAYRLSVPKGISSVEGGTLAQAHDFHFSTPPPKLRASGMETVPQVLDPVLLLQFDQAVDASEVLARTRLIGPEGRALALQQLAPDAAEVIAALAQRGAESIEGRWLALRPKQRLRIGSLYRVELAAGLPSLEGPALTTAAQGWSFSTFSALSLVSVRCAWHSDPRETCDPDEGWRLRFNNPLDAVGFDADTLRIEPAVEDLQVHAYHDTVHVRGALSPRTEYRLTLPAGLKDRFGQRLGRTEPNVLRTGDAAPLLYAAGDALVTLDPGSAPEFRVYTRSVDQLEVEIHRVQPEHWPAFLRWRADQRNEANGDPPPGERVARRFLRPLASGGLSETAIALQDYLPEGLGHLVLDVRPSAGQGSEPWHRRSVWLQGTRLGLVAVKDPRRMSAWVSALDSGRALEGVEVSLGATNAAARTDANGIALLELPEEGDASWLIARSGTDSALLPASTHYLQPAAWRATDSAETLRWMVFDDRGMYRPGESVRIKGWLRRLPADPTGDLQLPAADDLRLRWTLFDSHEVELGQGEAGLSSLGGFDLAIALPATPNLGPARLELRLDGSDTVDHAHEFWIEEFRRPEYEVRTEVDAGPHLIGGRARVEVEASYYAGGALTAAPVDWTLYARQTRYVPPGRSDFSFGDFLPWWSPQFETGHSVDQRLAGSTDALGRHAIALDFEGVEPARPQLLVAEARVSDLNRQTWSARSQLLVHPGQHYVGLKAARGFVQRGETLEVEVIVVDIDGALVSGAVPELQLLRLAWKQQRGRWSEVAEPAGACAPERLASGHLSCRWTPRLGGSHRVEARVRDSQGRQNGSELRLWVAGGEAPPVQSVEVQELLLVPDRQDPRPGETLRVLVQAPFAEAEGLLSLDRAGLLEQRRFALEQGSATLEIPIVESMVPGFDLQVAVVGRAGRADAQGKVVGTRPAAAQGSLQIGVPALARTLSVSVAMREPVLAPGGQTELRLEVRDANGAAVADAELAVLVVDESVLALTDYRTPDPLSVFYAAWPSQVQALFQHSQVLLGALPLERPAPSYGASGDPLDQITVTGSRILSAPMAPAPPPAEAGSDVARDAPIALRRDFSALALFAPEVRTDSEGSARLVLRLPDSLTRYRVMAVAVAGARAFGAGESSLTARKPLMLRPSPPRFLNLGDRFELPLMVQNQTDQPLEVELALRTHNARVGGGAQEGTVPEAMNAAGRSIRVPAQGRVELRIPVAAELPGQARFEAVIRAGELTDAQSFALPVWLPATREAFSTYGSLEGEGRVLQPLRRPADALPQVGGLQLGLASTELQSLTDALLYLVEYPFECNEQRASRVLAVAALRDVLQAFDAPGLPSPEALQEAVQLDLQRLQALQNDDGGWGFWAQDGRSWPYLSVHVANALVRASDEGYSVAPEVRDGALRYLRSIERHLPNWYHSGSQRSLRAYALDVRRRLGDADPAAAQTLLAEAQGASGLSIEALGWLLPSLRGAIDAAQFESLLRHVEQQASETAGTVQFNSARSDEGAHVLLHSARRADAVMLEALLELRPDHDLIEKLARGLLAHRVKGRWSNTQDNAFVLLALDRYFRVREDSTPDFTVRAWLDRRFAGEHVFRGRSTERVELRVPLADLGEPGEEVPLQLQKRGPGRLYYRIGLDYAPVSLQLDAADQGFAVERRYVAVDDPEDVRRGADGAWRIRAGARVRVELDMVATARRYHVALVDALPAGLEALNPALAVSESVPVDPERILPHSRWQRVWYEHQNLRDERVEAFTSLLWEGVHRYSYIARATTPGEFVVPPARAEEMYQPETFGRSATDRVLVESGDWGLGIRD
jgi:uncharacterized protein YfaS (alpha-2-macroglobulin family)